MSRPTSTQIGAVAENLVANALIVHSAGRLSPFSAIADDDGIDLLVYHKESGTALPVQVKSRTLALKKRGADERGNVVHFSIRLATFRSERDACVILALLRDDASVIECAWVIPMGKLRGLAARRAKVLAVRASKAPHARDRFRPFRCDGPKMLASRVEELVLGAGRLRS